MNNRARPAVKLFGVTTQNLAKQKAYRARLVKTMEFQYLRAARSARALGAEMSRGFSKTKNEAWDEDKVSNLAQGFMMRVKREIGRFGYLVTRNAAAPLHNIYTTLRDIDNYGHASNFNIKRLKENALRLENVYKRLAAQQGKTKALLDPRKRAGMKGLPKADSITAIRQAMRFVLKMKYADIAKLTGSPNMFTLSASILAPRGSKRTPWERRSPAVQQQAVALARRIVAEKMPNYLPSRRLR